MNELSNKQFEDICKNVYKAMITIKADINLNYIKNKVKDYILQSGYIIKPKRIRKLFNNLNISNLNYMGLYDSTIIYQYGDIVYFNHFAYICTSNNCIGVVPTDLKYWFIYACKTNYINNNIEYTY